MEKIAHDDDLLTRDEFELLRFYHRRTELNLPGVLVVGHHQMEPLELERVLTALPKPRNPRTHEPANKEGQR